MDRTKEIVMQAALEIIGRHGIDALTVRKITKKLGINVSAIHYHFGTKDNLVRESLEYFFSKISNLFAVLDDSQVSASVRLRTFMENYSSVFIEYPGVFISQIQFMIGKFCLDEKIMANQAPSNISPFLSLIRNGGLKVKRAVSEYTGITDEKVLGLKTIHILTGITHPIFLSDIPENVFGIDYCNSDIRKTYIDIILTELRNTTPSPLLNKEDS